MVQTEQFGRALWPGLNQYWANHYSNIGKSMQKTKEEVAHKDRCPWCNSKTTFTTINCNNCGGPI